MARSALGRCSSLNGTKVGAKSLKSVCSFSHAGPVAEPDDQRTTGRIGLSYREALSPGKATVWSQPGADESPTHAAAPAYQGCLGRLNPILSDHV